MFTILHHFSDSGTGGERHFWTLHGSHWGSVIGEASGDSLQGAGLAFGSHKISPPLCHRLPMGLWAMHCVPALCLVCRECCKAISVEN